MIIFVPMKNLLWLLPAALLLTACGNDPTDDPTPPGPDPALNEGAEANPWIYGLMSEWYLWPQDIGPSSEYDLDEDFRLFFQSLLSTDRLDGYTTSGGAHVFFSNVYREQTGTYAGIPTGEARPGFDVVGFSNAPQLLVCYVDPASDASAKGLRRGMTITAVNGETLTDANRTRIFESLFPVSMGGTLTATQLTLHTYNVVSDSNGVRRQNNAPIGFATMTDDQNPIAAHCVITLDGGHKVGYLNYLQFKTGYPQFDDVSYNDALKDLFREFAAEGVSDVVLDLRYNGGGAVVSAVLMASMLAPADKAGQVFSRSSFNDHITAKYYSNPASRTQEFLRVDQMTGDYYGEGSGVNLDLERLYVIVSEMSASASELVINSLEGVDVPVHLIGTPTLGKTVGMNVLRDGYSGVEGGYFTAPADGKRYRYTLEPITFSSVNAKGQADYVNGFMPDRLIDEFEYYPDWKEPGDPDELLLSIALDHIVTGSWAEIEPLSRSAAGSGITPLVSSRIRRDRGSLILRPADHE